jgi:hypothetical protein
LHIRQSGNFANNMRVFAADDRDAVRGRDENVTIVLVEPKTIAATGNLDWNRFDQSIARKTRGA